MKRKYTLSGVINRILQDVDSGEVYTGTAGIGKTTCSQVVNRAIAYCYL
jgi:hypothetical protein